MKIRFLIIAGLFFFSIASQGCRSINSKDLQAYPPNNKLLPPLEPQVDINSFYTAYSLGSSRTTGGYVGYGQSAFNGIITTGAYSANSTQFADKRVRDSITLFEREIRENISNGNTSPVGYAVCKIPTGESSIGWLWYIPSFLTGCVLNIFGMPFLTYETDLELEVEVKNYKGATIGRYRGNGTDYAFVAAWWGYSGGQAFYVTGNEGAARKSNIDAFKMAMADVKTKILADYDRLQKELQVGTSFAPSIAGQHSIGSETVPSQYDNSLNAVVVVSTPASLGSGFFINKEGYIITNNHVINSKQPITVFLRNKKTATAVVIAVDVQKDIALLHANVEPMSILEISDMKDSGAGTDVIAIGAPKGLDWTISKGIVSATREMNGTLYIQTDTPINPGNSGGPLVSIKTGKVVGINTWALTKSEGLNFAVSGEEIKKTFSQIR